MTGILGLVVIIACIWAYQSWLQNGVKARRVVTSLDPTALRSVFETTVVRTGWKMVDDGNPMVAQSSLATGLRQQISLKVEGNDNRSTALVGPSRMVTRLGGVPTKGHTIRLRLNSFTREIQRRDPSATIAKVG